MVRSLIAAALAMALAGCADHPPAGTTMPGGPAVSTPPQMTDFCRRNPGDPSC